MMDGAIFSLLAVMIVVLGLRCLYVGGQNTSLKREVAEELDRLLRVSESNFTLATDVKGLRSTLKSEIEQRFKALDDLKDERDRRSHVQAQKEVLEEAIDKALKSIREEIDHVGELVAKNRGTDAIVGDRVCGCGRDSGGTNPEPDSDSHQSECDSYAGT